MIPVRARVWASPAATATTLRDMVETDCFVREGGDRPCTRLREEESPIKEEHDKVCGLKLYVICSQSQ